MVVRRNKGTKEGKIEKPEDKEWRKWYGGLSKEDHKRYLAKLGLEEDDLDEMDEVKKELATAEATAEEKEE